MRPASLFDVSIKSNDLRFGTIASSLPFLFIYYDNDIRSPPAASFHLKENACRNPRDGDVIHLK